MRQAAKVQELAEREPEVAPATAARLSVSLVGRLAIRFNGQLVELRTQKAAAVLSYLALIEAKHESRERLVGLLWSRSDEEKARGSLRQVIRELRSAFEDAGYSGFVADRLSIHLDPEKVEVDVESIIKAAESGSVHPLLLNTPNLEEHILEGLDDLDPSFRVWVLAKRQTIHDRLMRSLGPALVATDLPAGARKDIAAAIVNLDPTHEEASCHLMQVHAEQGDVAGALRIYKALWDLLDRDYGMEPSLATEELVAKIKLGAFERPPLPLTVQPTGAHYGQPMEALTESIPPVLQTSKHPPRHASCCGLLRCMASTAITPTSCRDSTSISRHPLCASANGAWWIVLPPLLRSPRRIRRRNTVSKPPPIRRAPKSTW